MVTGEHKAKERYQGSGYGIFCSSGSEMYQDPGSGMYCGSGSGAVEPGSGMEPYRTSGSGKKGSYSVLAYGLDLI